MVTAEEVKRSEKKAPVNAVSSQVNGNLIIYSFLLYTRNAMLTSLLLLNLSQMFMFIFLLSTLFCKENKTTAIAIAVVFWILKCS